MAIPEDIKLWRRERRTALLAARAAIEPAARRERDAVITRLLQDAFPLVGGMVVGFYWPINGEFDPRFAIRHWRDQGAQAALPLVVAKATPLQFRAWWPGAPMARGVYDLPFPDGTPVVVPQAVLIPPVGFDEAGFRLGYGGGFFDRTLAALDPQPLKIAVACELSRMETIRPQPHDIPMDFVVTEAGVHAVGPAGLALVADPGEACRRARAIVAQRRIDAGQATQSMPP